MDLPDLSTAGWQNDTGVYVLPTEMEPMIRKLAEHTWAASRKESRIGRTVVLKLKTSEFMRTAVRYKVDATKIDRF